MKKQIDKIVKAHPKGVEFYQTFLSRKWRWRIKADNGRIIGASSQGYVNKQDCKENLLSVSETARVWYHQEKTEI